MRKRYTLFKRKNTKGKTVYYFYYYKGNRRVSASTGKTNKPEAERYIENQFFTGTAVAKTTLREYLEPYFTSRCPHVKRLRNDGRTISATWIHEQRRRLETHVLTDSIADMLLPNILPGDLEDFKDRLKNKGVGARTVNMVIGGLKTAFREGMHRGELSRDPAGLVGKVKENTAETGVFSLEELDYMFNKHPEVWGYDEKHPGPKGSKKEREALVFQVYCFAFLFATTGERPGTILTIKWKHLNGDLLTIENPKSGKERRIPLILRNVNNLQQLYDDGVYIGKEDYIFSTPEGGKRNYSWFRKRFSHMLRKTFDDNGKRIFPDNDEMGRKRTPYSLKHSFITHMLTAKADELLLREYVGHSHGHGLARILTVAQSRYRHKDTETLRTLLPIIESIYNEN